MRGGRIEINVDTEMTIEMSRMVKELQSIKEHMKAMGKPSHSANQVIGEDIDGGEGQLGQQEEA